MKRTTIYPITNKNSYLIDFLNTEKNGLFVESIVIPKAFEKNILSVRGIKTYNRIDLAIPNTDHVVFMPYWDNKRIYNEMESTLNAGKDVTSLVGLPLEEEKKFNNLALSIGR